MWNKFIFLVAHINVTDFFFNFQFMDDFLEVQVVQHLERYIVQR